MSKKMFMGLGVATVVVCAAAAMAQVQSGQDASKQSGQSLNAQASNQYMLNPEGWAVIAYDFNGDGTFDEYEYVNAYDLARVHGQQPGLAQQTSQQTCFQPGSATQQHLTGNVRDLFVTRFNEARFPHLLAKIDTQQGKAVVDLGAAHRIPRIQQGQFVQLAGDWGRVDNRPVFMADCLSTEGQMVQITRGAAFQRLQQIQGNLQEIQGDVISTRVVTADRTGRQYKIARVRLDTGQVLPVNLGPLAQIANLTIQPQTRIVALAAPAQIAGESGFRAHQFMINGQNVAVDWSPAGQVRERQRYQQAGFRSWR
jgi:hypothetical protein